MTDVDFEAAVAKLESAITTPEGGLRPIRRIEFELLDSAAIRWTLWEQCQGPHGAIRWRMAYSNTVHGEELGGPLTATKMVCEALAAELRSQHA